MSHHFDTSVPSRDRIQSIDSRTNDRIHLPGLAGRKLRPDSEGTLPAYPLEVQSPSMLTNYCRRRRIPSRLGRSTGCQGDKSKH
ncbi:hypothetical protein DSO57_1029159 [Entomophthora muscae]|uniref:Uncharacterized protein n=1 Tax=Entomophthora muscae TaxID=34485 RepID=A0ACC2RFZ9_9FUNG|nr:hypothetical protein DSO57_1029159 [Entomophthora muscae]